MKILEELRETGTDVVSMAPHKICLSSYLQKQEQELTVAQIMNCLLPNSDLN